MRSENIIIANLSCHGCVNTITKKLKEIKGVNDVKVDLETNEVVIDCEENVTRESLNNLLHSIGYPEATEKNGLLTHLRSIKSCFTGRFLNQN